MLQFHFHWLTITVNCIQRRKWVLGKTEIFVEDGTEDTRTSSIGWDWSSREVEEEEEELLILSSALARTPYLDNLEPAIPDAFEKETFCGNRVEREIGDEVATPCLFVFVNWCGGAKWEPTGNTAIVGEHLREREDLEMERKRESGKSPAVRRSTEITGGNWSVWFCQNILKICWFYNLILINNLQIGIKIYTNFQSVYFTVIWIFFFFSLLAVWKNETFCTSQLKWVMWFGDITTFLGAWVINL